MEPLFNEVLDITNDILGPGQSYSKMYGIEPRYNEFLDMYGLLTKCEVKMAGYWPSSFFCVFMDRDEVEVRLGP